jgi:glycosyltransferase involved in cell wall biosynthesis
VNVGLFKIADGTRLRAQWNVTGGIIGVLGNHDTVEELDKMLDTAKLLSKYNLTFIVAGRGSAIPKAKKDAVRTGLSNVKFLEEVAMQDAADVVSAFDVGLCLYSKTPADDARSPMRLLMYAAAGLPVVCTDLEEVRRMEFPNVIRVEGDPPSFADGILRGRQLPRTIPAQIMEYDIHRLTARYEQILIG